VKSHYVIDFMGPVFSTIRCKYCGESTVILTEQEAKPKHKATCTLVRSKEYEDELRLRAEIDKVLAQLEAGDYEIVPDDDD
jgi:hypothetical protein